MTIVSQLQKDVPGFQARGLFIDGAWQGVADNPVLNPADGRVVGHVASGGAAETAQAIDAAHRAFLIWRKELAKTRSAALRRWFDLIIAHTEPLAQLMTAEQGKPRAEARGEIAYAASFVEFYAEEAKRIYGETIPSHRADARIQVWRQPVGVVGAITPWNFPAAMITRKVAPAIAAGCTVVLKPAPDTPLTALALAELADQAGLPKGVLNVVTGDAEPIGATLMADARVRAIAFTGSTAVGKKLMGQAAATLKRVALELGGNAPFVVFDDADLEASVAGCMASKFRNAGQTCVCANRILVQDRVYDRFTALLAAEVAKLVVGPGDQAGVTTGPLINARAVEKVSAHVADARDKGARLIAGGNRLEGPGHFHEPTILTEVPLTARIAREETFGPVAALFRFSTEAEAIALANDTPSGLAAYAYARDLGRVYRVAEALEAGIVGINEGIISTEVAPFGGVKESGLGREGSHLGMDEFLDTKYVLMGGIGT